MREDAREGAGWPVAKAGGERGNRARADSSSNVRVEALSYPHLQLCGG